MKEKYENTEIEVVEFQAEDVILTSGEDPAPSDPPQT